MEISQSEIGTTAQPDSSPHTSENSKSSQESLGWPSEIEQGEWKPPVPYTVGSSFTIYCHFSDEPFGFGYDGRRPFPPISEGLEKMTQYEYCLANPPLEGVTVPDDYQKIQITKEIRVGQDCGAQIVVVGHNLVAKIFDPVYYDPAGNDCTYNYVMIANEDYCKEAKAFEELQGELEGREIPIYYGSWTMDIPVDGSHSCATRSVRLVLMEYLQGVCMAHLNPADLTEEERLNLVFRAMEAHMQILYLGVEHRDVSPRNIMICGKDFSNPEIRVCIIDFNVSTLDQLRYIFFPPHFRVKNRYRLPLSPIWAYATDHDEFSSRGWLPEHDKATAIIWDHYRNSPQYLPIHPEDPDDPYSSPVCPEHDRFFEEHFKWVELSENQGL